MKPEAMQDQRRPTVTQLITVFDVYLTKPKHWLLSNGEPS
jgi:hypothetical protein